MDCKWPKLELFSEIPLFFFLFRGELTICGWETDDKIDTLVLLWMFRAGHVTENYQYHDEVPLSKAPNPQLLPGRSSINGCPLLRVCVHGVCVHCCVCVHFGWVNCRAQIPSMCHRTWLYVTSLSSVSRSGLKAQVVSAKSTHPHNVTCSRWS